MPPAPIIEQLYFDNFDDGDISEYQQFGGTWTTVSEPGRGNVLRHTSNSNTVIFPQSESFSNSYQVIAEIWNEDNDAGGLAFRVNTSDGDNFYSCSASADGEFNAGIWQHVNDLAGTPTNQLAGQPWSYERSRWYDVTVTIDQGLINCVWESQEAGVELDVTAIDPNLAVSGSVGFWLSHQDNFKGDLLEVRSLGPPDITPPVISVQQPQNIAYSISDIPLGYTVSDDIGISGCSYELDGVTTSLPNCQNSILSSLTLQSHNVKVIATDTSNNIAESPLIVFTVTADTSSPQWSPNPENIVLLEGQPLFYDADATDNVAIDSFFIDDTTNFKIDSTTGILENNIPLSIGTYNLLLSVKDTSGNVNSVVITISVQEVGVTPPGFKVAFIGDQGLGSSDSIPVLELILNEGADMVLHQGDFDYNDDPDAWDNQINGVLGPDYPYFASIGNHDTSAWPGYQQKLIDRLALIDGATCTGDIGVKSSCTYKGLFFILSGAGTKGTGHATYIKDEMAQDNSIWRICSWHKNMKAMQVGGKSDSTGWEVYEECRIAGAIIATGHEHSYERTRTLSSIQNQIIDSAWPDVDNVRVGEDSSFVFVSGLGGRNIRDQERCLPTTLPYGCNGEWASIYTSNQGANFGALFCSFNVGGQANKAQCYFKDISGNIPDQFDITSFMGPASGSPPTAQPDTVTTTEDTSLNINVLANDSDPDGDTLFLDSFDLTSVNGGTITRDDKGTPNDKSDDEVAYTPNLNFNGVDTFKYIVSDGLNSSTGMVTVTVTPINDPPVADDQSVTTQEDTSVLITLTASDVDGDTLTYSTTSPSNGQLTGTAPNLTYTPDPNFNGNDSFTFNVNDGLVDSNTATVSITVEETNVAPVLDPIGNKITDELTELTFTATATDSNTGQILTFSLADGLGGSIPAGASIGSTTGVFTWTPSEAQGPDTYTFDVVVTDDGIPPLSGSEKITVTVNEVNTAPTLDPIGDQTVAELTQLSFTATATDSDAPSQGLTFSLSDGAAGQVPAGASIDSTTGIFSWTPTESDGPGTLTFDVVVTDDGLPPLSDSETITVTVTEASATITAHVTILAAPNIPPVADADLDQTVDEGDLVTLDGTASFDQDGDPITLAWNQIAGPVVALSSNNIATPTFIAPQVNDTTVLTFQLIVNDGTEDSAPDTVDITVRLVLDTEGQITGHVTIIPTP